MSFVLATTEMFSSLLTTSVISILFSVLIGGFIGWCLHRFLTKEKQTNNNETDDTFEANCAQERKKDEFSGRMNLNCIRKREVVFDSIVNGKEKKKSISENVEKPLEELADQDDEEQSSSKSELDHSNTPMENSDNVDIDKINSTLGKLHGKLATAQLKAQTRQIAAVMSDEEREYETRMKDDQMASIVRLMMQNQEKFGMSSDDIKEQMNLYNF